MHVGGPLMTMFAFTCLGIVPPQATVPPSSKPVHGESSWFVRPARSCCRKTRSSTSVLPFLTRSPHCSEPRAPQSAALSMALTARLNRTASPASRPPLLLRSPQLEASDVDAPLAMTNAPARLQRARVLHLLIEVSLIGFVGRVRMR